MSERDMPLVDKAIEAAYQHGAEAYADLAPHDFTELDLFVLRKLPAIEALYDAIPFGFTWDDVDRLLEVSKEIASWQLLAEAGIRAWGPPHGDWAGPLAQRIAALLPPRE